MLHFSFDAGSVFQLELAGPNYMTRKIETFKRFLVNFEHRTIVFDKVASSVIEESLK